MVQGMSRRRPGDKPLFEPHKELFTDAYLRHVASI